MNLAHVEVEKNIKSVMVAPNKATAQGPLVTSQPVSRGVGAHKINLGDQTNV